MQSPTRRTFLAFGTLASAGLLAACTGSGSGGSTPRHSSKKADPDLPLRTRAVAATDALLGQYDALLAGAGASDARLKPLRAEIAAQRTALATGLPASTSSPSASPSVAAVPTVATLAAAERTTAQARLADLDAASPELARLLASASAAGARHAVALGDQTALTVPADPAASPGASTASPSRRP